MKMDMKDEIESKIKTLTEYEDVLQSQIRHYEDLIDLNDRILEALMDDKEE